MKKTLLALTLIMAFLWSTPAMAQNYKAAIGARLGYPISLSGKMFLNETSAVEGFVGTRGYTYYRWVTVGLAYQIHKPLEIENIEGLNWYYGAGINAYFWSYKDTWFDDDNTSTSYGVAGYVGLDYTFSNHPVSITVDWVPTYFINSTISGFGAGYGSLGVRYIFSRGD